MPITDRELPGLPVKRHPPSGRIKADEGHDKYKDWHEDDTERDPTPANKRRTEHFKATSPKNGDGPDEEGRMLTANSRDFTVGLPKVK